MTVDNTAIIKRIIAILEDNVPLAAKVRSFRFGEDDNEFHEGPYPYILVTTPNRLITNRDSFGVGDGSADNQTIVQYQIMGFVDGNNSEKAETEKYDLMKQVLDILVANPRLKDPTSDDDPKCIRSTILTGDNRPDTRGKENQGFVITLQCQVGSAFTIDIAGFTDVALISKPVELEVQNTESIYNTARERKGVSPISETHAFFAELEHTAALDAALRSTQRARSNITTTLHRPSGDTVYTGRLVEISNGAAFDQLETISISFEVIH